jgi:transcriptional antiterminator
MIKPNVMVIGKTTMECLTICRVFDDHARFVDYETDLLRIIDDDFIIYDIFVYDYDNIDHDLVRFVPNVINIVICGNNDSEFLNNLISMGADIIIRKDLDGETIKNTMLICSLITKNLYQ